jgi:hypothetical protein
MSNRLSKAWNTLLGRDKETPGERAFRHEREQILSPIFPMGVAGLCAGLILLMVLLPSLTLIGIIQYLVCVLMAETSLYCLANSIIKSHQKKHGGD